MVSSIGCCNEVTGCYNDAITHFESDTTDGPGGTRSSAKKSQGVPRVAWVYKIPVGSDHNLDVIVGAARTEAGAWIRARSWLAEG